MKLKTLLLVGSLTAMSSAFAGGNLLTNGSFESPALTAGTSASLAASTILDGGWTVIGGEVQLVTSTYLANYGYNLSASNASQWLDLTGTSEGSGKGLSITAATVIGQGYTLSFDVGTLGQATSVTFSINGDVHSFTNSAITSQTAMNWAGNSFSWTADLTNTEIRFLGASGGTVIGLDNVAITTAVPEPESYAMLLAGLGLMGTIARRRKNKSA